MENLLNIIAVGMFGAVLISLLNIIHCESDHDSYDE